MSVRGLLQTRVRGYLRHHAQTFRGSLGILARTPLASAFTVAVIGITLALPTGLYVAVGNLQRLSRGWEGDGRISLFLKTDVASPVAQNIADRLRRLPSVASVDYISRTAAFAEFKRTSGFGAALDLLDHNPLPAVLVVHPSPGHDTPARLQALAKHLGRLHEVDLVRLDLDWVRRLSALLALAERAVLILGALLGLAALLVIGNTIRLAILARREEIEIVRLIGGTNAFIRRPFLYTGSLQGLLGAGTAYLLVTASLALLAGPIATLSGLYAASFIPRNLAPAPVATLLLGGAAIGWLGSWFAVSWHLYTMDRH